MSFLDDVRAGAEDLYDMGGIDATYTPIDQSIPAFSCTVLTNIEELIDLGGGGYEDRTKCKILHATLVANGISEPTAHNGARSGDQISFESLAGDQTWEIVSTRPDYYAGEWVLEIARNTRFEPT